MAACHLPVSKQETRTTAKSVLAYIYYIPSKYLTETEKLDRQIQNISLFSNL